MRAELLLLGLGLTAVAGFAAPQQPGLQRKALQLSSEFKTAPMSVESEVTMPEADAKVLTYLSPDPFYVKSINPIPAQQGKLSVMTRYNDALLGRFKGNRAKKLVMVAPEEAIRVSVFILDDNGEKLYEKEVENLSELPGCDVWGVGYLWGHEISLDVDFEIDGNPFILGYEIEVEQSGTVPSINVIIQDVPTKNVCLVDQCLGAGMQPYYGAPYMNIYTEGDGGLLEYDASLVSVNPMRVAVDQNFNEGGTFVNLGTKPITNITFDYENADGSKQSYELTSSEPYGYMSAITFSLPMTGNSVSSSDNCQVTISKLDGNADAYPSDNTLTASIISMKAEDAPERTVVVEMATGTWCGFCPRALASIDYLPEYTDTKHIPIEVHVNDNFEGKNIENYKPYVNAAPGLPYAWVNRSVSCDPWQGLGSDPLAYGFGDVVKLLGMSMVELSVDVKAGYDPEAGTIRLESTTTPVIDLPDGNRYKVGFALLENGLKAYQNNSYSGKAEYPYPKEYVPEPMLNWWEADTRVEWEYSYTLRTVSDANGSESLGEGTVSAAATVENSYTFDASDVNDYTNSIAVAFVFDTLAGEIVNAAQSAVTNLSSVNDINVAAPSYTLAGGVLSLGIASDVEVYDISGRKVLSVANSASVDLTSLKGGIYVIDATSQEGHTTMKVAL